MSELFELGYWPTVQTLYHQGWGGSGTLVQVLRVDGPLGADLLAEALAGLCRRHPLLRARIVETPHGFGYAVEPPGRTMPPLTLAGAGSSGAPRAGDGDDGGLWLAERELAQGVGDGPGPPWRVTLAAGPEHGRHTLAMTFHHALADARAAASLSLELLERCAALVRGESPPGPEPLPLLPPVERAVLRLSPTTWPEDGEDAASETEAAPAAAAGSWACEGQAPLAERRTRLLDLPFPPGLWPALRAACREEGVTVQAAAMAALLRAAAPACRAAGRLPLAWAVDLRRLSEPPVGAEHCGCFVTMLSSWHEPDPARPFWELARQCRQSLRQRLARQQAQGFAPRRFRRATLQAMIQANLRRGEEQRIFPEGPALSNLGPVALPEAAGPFTLEALRFTTDQRSGLYLLFLSLVTLGGRPCGCLGYTEPLLSTGSAGAIAAGFVEQWVRAVQDR